MSSLGGLFLHSSASGTDRLSFPRVTMRSSTSARHNLNLSMQRTFLEMLENSLPTGSSITFSPRTQGVSGLCGKGPCELFLIQHGLRLNTASLVQSFEVKETHSWQTDFLTLVTELGVEGSLCIAVQPNFLRMDWAKGPSEVALWNCSVLLPTGQQGVGSQQGMGLHCEWAFQRLFLFCRHHYGAGIFDKGDESGPLRGTCACLAGSLGPLKLPPLLLPVPPSPMHVWLPHWQVCWARTENSPQSHDQNVCGAEPGIWGGRGGEGPHACMLSCTSFCHISLCCLAGKGDCFPIGSLGKVGCTSQSAGK